ncbi:hypothetical protein DL766_009805 [Monosporascus sp. MC13-8B]|uniref:MARVEL domain-containing protein n=1 Tax=Monosporascus cannonballus TaxID=155416 RepID=A0ABY0GZ51_9PEZI|nr:hypothetical protein DL762_008957 [Monosporascus cannonballus]RYO80232.1 hypothetical protein DL763_008987 [Monosporascus cannonballus]RYP13865.1 hypothetical protein DL766_009805 [Monosporascus sp. MC13-8B]
MSQCLFILVAAAAILATAAISAMNIIVAQAVRIWTAPTRIAAIVGSVFEGLLLVLLIALVTVRVRRSTTCIGPEGGIWFASLVLASVLASAASIAVLISMSKSAGLPTTILGASPTGYLIGAAITLAFAFTSQLVLFVFDYLSGRLSSSGQGDSLHAESRYCPEMRLKAIPYSKTAASTTKTRGTPSEDHMSRPGTSSGRSTAETMSSIRTSISHVVRPFSSKTRLLSSNSRGRQRAASFDSDSYRSRSSYAQDGFDSWDTSAAESHHRQSTLDTFSSTPSRVLETIPASPSTSRSPSPGHSLDLEPPKQYRRSRSFSPVPSLRRGYSQSPEPCSDELHIHPLFRSNTPTPPPQASPRTVVVAAPNAGKVISEKSLTRMRSGSLPTTPSPLSRQASHDSFRKNTESLAPPEEAEEGDMTPPIADWISSTGSRTSLTEYTTRRLRELQPTPEEAETGSQAR